MEQSAIGKGSNMSEEKLRHKFIGSVVILRSFARRVGNGRFKLENPNAQEMLKEVEDALAFLDSYHDRVQEVTEEDAKPSPANVIPMRPGRPRPS
jgi:hypothetical protein